MQAFYHRDKEALQLNMGFFNRAVKEVVKNTTKLSEVLKERGYVYQHTGELEEVVDGEKRTLYLGIDPTADSMHVGHFMGLLVMRRFLENGHKIILLTGGGTGMIGDPGGKSDERNLLDRKTAEENSRAVAGQIRKVFGSSDFIEENNAKWLAKINLLEFLRDIGKHFTVNSMIKKDTVKTRLDAESPMSFTEFSYSLLQGYDFLHLNEQYGCDLQVGGSDQWTNILSGVEFIRRKEGKTVHAFTWPLVINRSTGKKFGKSEGGAVWLDPKKTPPFQFYQFWFNTSDEDVEEYLLKMTLVSKEDIDAVMDEQRAAPASRAAQKRLAHEVTTLVHGEAEARKAKEESEALFAGKAPADMQGVPGGKLRDIVVGMSTSELRRLVDAGAVSYVESGEKISSIDTEVKNTTLKIGKNRFIRVD
jgi:tyrosyl-tRNA synthetase